MNADLIAERLLLIDAVMVACDCSHDTARNALVNNGWDEDEAVREINQWLHGMFDEEWGDHPEEH